MCKKQGAVSHSTSEAEVIALEAGTRLEGLPALLLWDLVIDILSPGGPGAKFEQPKRQMEPESIYKMFGSIDYVPPSLPITYGQGKLFLLEDNDAGIKMVVKGRSPQLRHVARTHRVNLDWLFERIKDDPGCSLKFVGTKEQMADILTKGSFTADSWNSLTKLILMIPSSSLKSLSSK